MIFFFFVKQKTAYEMRISGWSSDVCSSDLDRKLAQQQVVLCTGLRVAIRKLHILQHHVRDHRQAIEAAASFGRLLRLRGGGTRRRRRELPVARKSVV